MREQIDINRSVEALEFRKPFGIRIYCVCCDNRIVTIRDLCLRTNWDLIQTRNLGYKSIAHIEKILGEYGLRLGMTDKELDAYMGIESEEDAEHIAALMRLEEAEAVKWEQRRYEVSKELYIRRKKLSPYEAMAEAEKLILALQGMPEKKKPRKRWFELFNR
ncbi:DNA-directed RNA polymerase subunit alpha C-terminal domain-containing protein [Paraprevotella clara]|uniref:DNA-directed RNA polymerase subunit alpha C-terminal domain-containing protein n=1 Tax=Paraprevotella clara TaxID=454154 RepID=UPI003FEE0DDC